jgi:hypothetical protein
MRVQRAAAALSPVVSHCGGGVLPAVVPATRGPLLVRGQPRSRLLDSGGSQDVGSFHVEREPAAAAARRLRGDPAALDHFLSIG